MINAKFVNNKINIKIKGNDEENYKLLGYLMRIMIDNMVFSQGIPRDEAENFIFNLPNLSKIDITKKNPIKVFYNL